MKTKLLGFSLTLLLFIFSAKAQVGVGNTNPQAQLDISASSTGSPTNLDGILIPRVSNLPAVGAMTSFQDGMLIFYTGTGNSGKGFYYWNQTSTSWEKIASGTIGDNDWYEVGTTNAPDDINDNIFTQGRVAIGTNSTNTNYNFTSESLSGNTQILLGNRSNTVPGAEIEVTGAGTDGLRINLAGAQNSSDRYAVEADVSGGLTSRFGFLNAAPVNQLTGVRNDITMGGFYTYDGMHNLFSGTSTDPVLTHHGVYNYVTANVSGLFRGVENRILGGGGNKTGLYNIFGSNAGGFLIGHNMTVNGSNTTASYIAGLTVSIPSTVTATNQYGIYSDVTRANGYSGYFLGRVSIGTTTSNNYILPGTRGNNGYVIQSTGGTGTTWADPTSLGTDDQNIQNLAFNASTNILTVGIENGTAQTVNLSALDSGGDINQVNAGNGLTGGGATGNVTINAVGVNGITTNANDFRLGGALIQNTAISQGVQSFDINLNSTGDFAIQDNGTDVFFVEDSGDIGVGVSNPEHPFHMQESLASEREGIYVDKNDNTTQETNGIYVEKSGSGTGRSHAIRTRNDGTGTGQKYGIFNTISATASGSQYGIRNFLAGASPSGQFGTFNNLDNNGTGTHYGVYNGMRGASAANLYGVYNEFDRAYTSPADVVGVRNRFSNGIPGTNGMIGVWTDFTTPTNGNFYGTRNEFTNTATGTGNKYGTYNLFSASAGGTHYGTYNSVSVADGWAGYFLGRNYISQRLSIGETDNANSSLNIRRNSGSSTSHIELKEAGGNDGARIRFSNTIETANEWVLYGRADNTLADNTLNFFHSALGNILEIKGDGDVEINGQLGININNPTYAITLPNNATIGTGRGRANAWTTYSDARVKSDQQPLQNGLSIINKMLPKTYFHHNGDIEDGVLNLTDSGEQTLGFIAQELHEILPEAVQKPEDENIALWSVNYDKVIPVAVKAIQELNTKVKILEAENKSLKQQLNKLEQLETRLLALERNNN